MAVGMFVIPFSSLRVWLLRLCGVKVAMASLCGIELRVPSDSTPRIQEVAMKMLHQTIARLESQSMAEKTLSNERYQIWKIGPLAHP
jgi:hypothetical protein